MSLELYHPGLRGVVAGETEISRLDGGLQYRGYCIHDLVERASFDEVAYLLVHEELPTQELLADFRSILVEEARLPLQVGWLFEQVPLHTSPIDALRTAVSLLAHFDPQPDDDPIESAVAKATRLLSRIPMLLSLWHRQRSGLPPLEMDDAFGHAANLLYLLTGKLPCVLHEHALEAALIVAAEQEFNPSTYAARVVASTQADMYAAVLAGLGTLSGVAHGGGNDRVLQVLHEVAEPEQAAAWVQSLPQHAAIPGFGHPVYRDCDPRAAILEPICQELAEGTGQTQFEAVADAVEHAVWDQRRQPANLDWPFVRLLHYLGLPSELHLPLFVCARTAGWCAHAIEQARDGGVIRPRARYRGAEDLEFVPLQERDG